MLLAEHTDNSIIHSPVRMSSQFASVTSLRLSGLAAVGGGPRHIAASAKYSQEERRVARRVKENIPVSLVLLAVRRAMLVRHSLPVCA